MGAPLGGPRGIFLIFFRFFDFLGPAPILGVLDIVLLIPEVWDFYLFSNATFFFIIKPIIFIVFSLLSSPRYSSGSPGAPPDRKTKKNKHIFQFFMYFSYKLSLDPINRP